jgi:hypothetical protein
MAETLHNGCHSADVRIHLNVNGFTLPVGQLGPEYLILRESAEHAPTTAEIVMSINGKVRRWNVHLPDGISASRVRTKIE